MLVPHVLPVVRPVAEAARARHADVGLLLGVREQVLAQRRPVVEGFAAGGAREVLHFWKEREMDGNIVMLCTMDLDKQENYLQTEKEPGMYHDCD